MKKLLLFYIILIIIMFLPSCGPKTIEENLYKKISSQEAKKIMENEKNIIILDVRSEEEFETGHIEDAILIPLNDIDKQARLRLNNKNQHILVYCRSGNRSKTAAKKLIKVGYTNVYDFGGIIDWSYETVK